MDCNLRSADDTDKASETNTHRGMQGQARCTDRGNRSWIKAQVSKTYDDAGGGAAALADEHRELARFGHGRKVRLDELTVGT